jgi:hypothetical protein
MLHGIRIVYDNKTRNHRGNNDDFTNEFSKQVFATGFRHDSGDDATEEEHDSYGMTVVKMHFVRKNAVT